MVRWYADKTGRFKERPYYSAEELDHGCERVTIDFLTQRHGAVSYPMTTDDLVVMVEQHVDDLDVYADLTSEGDDVEGMTCFVPASRPRVLISRALSEAPHREVRYRTTLAHELGHVRLHDPVFQSRFATADLFADFSSDRIVCKRETIIDAPKVDWLEWQAGYASGAYLMPKSAVFDCVRSVAASVGLPAPYWISDPIAADLIAAVADQFAVSRDAARVRLLQLNRLSQVQPAHALL